MNKIFFAFLCRFFYPEFIVLGAWLGLIVGTWLVQREYARTNKAKKK